MFCSYLAWINKFTIKFYYYVQFYSNTVLYKFFKKLLFHRLLFFTWMCISTSRRRNLCHLSQRTGFRAHMLRLEDIAIVEERSGFSLWFIAHNSRFCWFYLDKEVNLFQIFVTWWVIWCFGSRFDKNNVNNFRTIWSFDFWGTYFFRVFVSITFWIFIFRYSMFIYDYFSNWFLFLSLNA
jgi:hypothetical protein